jgi:hypothetical protein
MVTYNPLAAYSAVHGGEDDNVKYICCDSNPATVCGVSSPGHQAVCCKFCSENVRSNTSSVRNIIKVCNSSARNKFSF